MPASDTQFKPGQSGNPKGRPKTKPFKDALQEIINEVGLAGAARALVTKANEGDVAALRELADRMDGKVAQAVIGGDEDDPAINIVHRIERAIVDPNNPNS